MGMSCRRCGDSLDRPGDFCLLCRSANADAVALAVGRSSGTLTMLRDQAVVGETTITTVPESGPEAAVVERRNYAGRIADEIHRKRPETVYAAGDRKIIGEIRSQCHHEFRHIDGTDPVDAARAAAGSAPLDKVDLDPAENIGGRHSTLIGGRHGMRAIGVVAEHPNVKKIVPGPIDAGGTGSQTGVRAKATRADQNGNVRLLLRTGASIQENRVITTAADRDGGEHVREDLNDALRSADL